VAWTDPDDDDYDDNDVTLAPAVAAAYVVDDEFDDDDNNDNDNDYDNDNDDLEAIVSLSSHIASVSSNLAQAGIIDGDQQSYLNQLVGAYALQRQ
jgi:hypothetical protein